MKKALIEFRFFFAEKMLVLAYDIAPKTKGGDNIKSMVFEYFANLNIKP